MAEPIRWIRTVVVAAEDVGASVRQLTLADPDGWELPPFRPGAHVDVNLGDGLVRTYSLVNPPCENTVYTIGVKREPNGRGGSLLLHDRIGIGDELGASLPRGGIDTDRHAAFRLIAGGVGVTPWLSVVSHLLRNGRDDVRLDLFTRNAELYTAVLTPLEARGLAFVHHTGRGSRPQIADLIGSTKPDILVACCGPIAMLDDFSRATTDWDASQIHIERFTAPHIVVDDGQQSYVAVLAESGRQIDVTPGTSLLSALRTAGVEVSASCEGGVCGACRVAWSDGEPVHRDYVLSAEERTHTLLSCVSGCRTDKLVLDL